MLEKTKGFTLAEILITLAVLGILAAIMLPTVTQARPNKHKSLFKKAYYVAERMVYELVNDEDLYPSTSVTLGLDNVSDVEYLGTHYGSASVENDKKSKFCGLFARKVNTTSDTAQCDSVHSTFANTDSNKPSFKTTDGIAWYMPFTDFSGSGAETIRVDVNGEAKPNCAYSNTCPDPDRFEIRVVKDGKMFVNGTKEKEYLESNNSLR